MMTILYYIPSIDEASGGVGAYMQLLAIGLGKLVELHVVTHRSENDRRLVGCHLHYIPEKYLPRNKSKKAFMKAIREVKLDIVHVNCCWTPLCPLVTFYTKDAGYKRLHEWLLRKCEKTEFVFLK